MHLEDHKEYTILIRDDLYKKLDVLYSELGMSIDVAIKIFFKQCVRENGIPFKITLNGSQTISLSERQNE